jgi:NADPH:quinone reductase-like Zn-dependent oxidoreductase
MGRATSVRWKQNDTEKPSLEVVERDIPDPKQGQVQISVQGYAVRIYIFIEEISRLVPE